MGLKRLLWRSTSIGRSIDTIKNIVDEGGIVKGFKRTLKEDICEDNPVTATIYQVGKLDGKEAGYAEASYEYEQKLLEQADTFIKQQKVYKEEKEAYQQLLNEYEALIEDLNGKINRTEAENKLLQALLIKERELLKIKTA